MTYRILALPLAVVFAHAAGMPPIEPQILGTWPHGVRRGGEIEVTIRGRNLQNANAVRFASENLSAEVLEASAYHVKARVRVAADAELGRHDFRLIAPHGSILGWFDVSDREETFEREPNNTRDKANPLTFPALVNGIVKAGDYDYYRFEARAGQTLTFDLLATRNGSPLDGVVSLLDAYGNEIDYSDDYYGFKDPHLVHRFGKDGVYYLRVYGSGESGSDNADYRLIAGEMPHAYYAMPSGGRQGDEVEVALRGVNLDRVEGVTLGDGIAQGEVIARSFDETRVRLRLPRDLAPGEYRLHAGGATLPVPFVVGASPEITVQRTAARNRRDPLPVTLPVVANGVIDTPRAADYFTFRVDRPQTVLFEASSMQLGFLLDPLVIVYDEDGKRIAWQDEPTTNTGKEPANLDPHLAVALPKAGRYTVAIRDSQFRGNPAFAYRLKVKPAEPDFTLRVVGTSETLYRGRENTVLVRVRRLEGWNTPIEVWAENLPAGVTAPKVAAEPKNTPYTGTCGEIHYLDGTNVEIPFHVSADAPLALSQIVFRGRGVMDGREVERTARTRYWKSRQKILGDSAEHHLYATVADAPGVFLQVPEKAKTGRMTVIVTRLDDSQEPMRIEGDGTAELEPVEIAAGVTRADLWVAKPGRLVLVGRTATGELGRSHPITVEGNMMAKAQAANDEE